jgi:outer membrane murein-binding lipoprotein Lpp
VIHISTSETELIAQIERLESDARGLRRRIEHAHNAADKKVLNRQLQEIKEDIDRLRWRLR